MALQIMNCKDLRRNPKRMCDLHEDNIRMSAVCSGVEGDESRLDITADAEC